ncbi:hypothetical protein, partial [Burkholderia cenocepacia]|uniref:hypothetical protein n=1 Tax=Burkholderia cenocepacia TaxID=95486 RepID=UPI00406CEE7C
MAQRKTSLALPPQTLMLSVGAAVLLGVALAIGGAAGQTVTADTETLALVPGLEFLGYGFNAKELCKFESCKTRPVVEWTFAAAKTVRLPVPVPASASNQTAAQYTRADDLQFVTYRVPDQVLFESIGSGSAGGVSAGGNGGG